MTALLRDDTELFKQFSDNPSFKRWLTDTIFTFAYDQPQRSTSETVMWQLLRR
jgi:type I restriction enzyme R subunit